MFNGCSFELSQDVAFRRALTTVVERALSNSAEANNLLELPIYTLDTGMVIWILDLIRY